VCHAFAVHERDQLAPGAAKPVLGRAHEIEVHKMSIHLEIGVRMHRVTRMEDRRH
jgi:hypothetical protein